MPRRGHHRFLTAVVVLAGLTAGCAQSGDAPSRAPAQVPAAPAADPRALAADLPLLPIGVDRAVRPLAVVRASYEFAARHPEVLKYVPCFCGCERAGHEGSHDCFIAGRSTDGRVTVWEPHALHCEVCIDVAYQASQMHRSGASVSAIRAAIDSKYTRPGGARTPTPPPPHGGPSSH